MGSVVRPRLLTRKSPKRLQRHLDPNAVNWDKGGNTEGGPVHFRAIIDDVPEAPMKPTSSRFVPQGAESFAYTFVGRTGPFNADDTHRFNVQWRSPTGAQVTMHQGAINLLFQRGTQGCP
jgi:hypothetical protein